MGIAVHIAAFHELGVLRGEVRVWFVVHFMHCTQHAVLKSVLIIVLHIHTALGVSNTVW